MFLPIILQALVSGMLSGEYSFVTRGATLKCTQGTDPGVLNMMIDHGIYSQNEPLLNVADAVCGANISKEGAFGFCKVTGDVCKPTIPFGSKWSDGKEDVLIEGEQALLSKSTLVCSCGGMISIEQDGQEG